MAFVYSKTYTIESVIEENAGRHRVLLAGGLLQQIDAREMRTFLARYLYKRMRQKPAFIFVYDRREDFDHPLGFSIARLRLPQGSKQYQVDVRSRDGLTMPSVEDLTLYDKWADYCCEHEGNPPDADQEETAKVQAVAQFLYQAPVTEFTVST